jgi:hypothetical protein
MLFFGLGVYLFPGLRAKTTCALSEDDIRSNLREEEEQYRYKGAVEDDLTKEDPIFALAKVSSEKMERDLPPPGRILHNQATKHRPHTKSRKQCKDVK